MAERPAAVRQPDEAVARGEMEMTRAWLTMLRDGAVFKLDGLNDEQLRWKPTPTANSLGTLVRHLGLAERLWFRATCAGEEMDMEWRRTMFDQIPDDWSLDDLIAFYRAECDAADRAIDKCASLEDESRAPWRKTTWRWAMVHMIEETARHLGHMDITRELIDGQVGR